MAYNVDFLLSALVFLLIILNHFMQQRALNTKSTKAFLIFLLLGIANIIFDLLCTLLITLARPDLAWMTECCLTILYLLQIQYCQAAFGPTASPTSPVPAGSPPSALFPRF